MSGKKKQEARFSLNSPIITVGKESTSLSSRSGTKTEKSIISVGKESTSLSTRSRTKTEKSIIITRKPPTVFPNLLPYTPPDALMFDLFNAIQRKAWLRARRLCYELILCDPLRQNYRNLHSKIDQIIKISDQRLRPKRVISRTTTASSSNMDGRTTGQR